VNGEDIYLFACVPPELVFAIYRFSCESFSDSGSSDGVAVFRFIDLYLGQEHLFWGLVNRASIGLGVRKMPKPKSDLKITVSTVISAQEGASLDYLVRAKKKTKGALVRDAIRHYIKYHKRLETNGMESVVEERIRKAEDHLSSLIAKLVLVSGQNLYYSLVPYMKGGLPSRPLTKESYGKIWNQSEQFAVDVLKQTRRREEEPGDNEHA
jgi:hypothetical protein